MPSQPGYVFSITIRPKIEDLPEYKAVCKWLIKIAKKYIIAVEGDGSHYQIGVELSTPKRSDKLRDMICKEFETKFNAVALVVKAHDDWKYLVGYCAKEGQNEINFDKEEFHSCTKHYEFTKNLKSKMTGIKKIGVDEIGDLVVDYCKKHPPSNIDGSLSNAFLARALKEIAKGIKLSTWNRLSPEKLLSYVRFQLEVASLETCENRGPQGGTPHQGGSPILNPVHEITTENIRQDNVRLSSQDWDLEDLLC